MNVDAGDARSLRRIDRVKTVAAGDAGDRDRLRLAIGQRVAEVHGKRAELLDACGHHVALVVRERNVQPAAGRSVSKERADHVAGRVVSLAGLKEACNVNHIVTGGKKPGFVMASAAAYLAQTDVSHQTIAKTKTSVGARLIAAFGDIKRDRLAGAPVADLALPCFVCFAQVTEVADTRPVVVDR